MRGRGRCIQTSGGRDPARSSRRSCSGSSAEGDSGCRHRSTSNLPLLDSNNKTTIVTEWFVAAAAALSAALSSPAMWRPDLPERMSIEIRAESGADGPSGSRSACLFSIAAATAMSCDGRRRGYWWWTRPHSLPSFHHHHHHHHHHQDISAAGRLRIPVGGCQNTVSKHNKSDLRNKCMCVYPPPSTEASAVWFPAPRNSKRSNSTRH